jgi:hypothetical protein
MRSQMPEYAETGMMLSDNGFWFDNNKSILPGRSKPVKQDPKQSIAGLNPRARMFSFEHAQLLVKNNNFKTEIATRTEEGTEK